MAIPGGGVEGDEERIVDGPMVADFEEVVVEGGAQAGEEILGDGCLDRESLDTGLELGVTGGVDESAPLAGREPMRGPRASIKLGEEPLAP